MKTLFYRDRLSNFLETRKAQVLSEVQSLPSSEVTNTSEDELTHRLACKYRLFAPQLLRDQLYMHPQKEVQVDVSRDPNRFIRDRSRPAYLPGMQFTIIVPFEGSDVLFDYAPSTFTSVLARGDIDRKTSELRLTYTQVDADPEEIKREYEQDLNLISRYLGWVAQDVSVFNASLDRVVRDAIAGRRTRLQSAEDAAKGLGIPIRPPK